VAISRRISDRWRLIGAGIVGWSNFWYQFFNAFRYTSNYKYKFHW
jgi:hypothetical protein